MLETIKNKAEKLITSAEQFCKGQTGEAIEALLLAAASLYRAKHKGGDPLDFERRARLAYDEVHVDNV